VNYFAPFLLTHLLLDQVAAAPHGRIINTASVAHRWGNIHLDRLHEPRSFGVFNYFDTKLALVMFTRRMASKLPAHVTCNCLHPGIIGTDIATTGGMIAALMKVGKPVMRRPRSGAKTPVHLASAPELTEVTGEYFVGTRPVRSSRRSRDEATIDALWEHSREITGV
jgi:NAD(P)-dependent dehydrogenase (short-subunit alcohol dehydrogenase family)